MDTNQLKQLRADTELKRDLWPTCGGGSRADHARLALRLALIAAVAVWVIAFPEASVALLYHL